MIKLGEDTEGEIQEMDADGCSSRYVNILGPSPYYYYSTTSHSTNLLASYY